MHKEMEFTHNKMKNNKMNIFLSNHFALSYKTFWEKIMFIRTVKMFNK